MQEEKIRDVLSDIVIQVVKQDKRRRNKDGQAETRQQICERCRKPCNKKFTCEHCPVNDGNDWTVNICNKRCKRIVRAEHSKEHKRKRDRDVNSERMANETPDAREKRLKKMRARTKNSRAMETPHEKEERLSKMRKFTKNSRTMETSQQCFLTNCGDIFTFSSFRRKSIFRFCLFL